MNENAKISYSLLSAYRLCGEDGIFGVRRSQKNYPSLLLFLSLSLSLSLSLIFLNLLLFFSLFLYLV